MQILTARTTTRRGTRTRTFTLARPTVERDAVPADGDRPAMARIMARRFGFARPVLVWRTDIPARMPEHRALKAVPRYEDSRCRFEQEKASRDH